MKSHRKKYFKLFANCIPVKGATKSIICDLQKGGVTNIPSEIIEILLKANKNIPIAAIKSDYDNEQDKGIDLFFDELVRSGLGFYTNDAEGFIDLSEEWDYPGEISNAIIDVVKSSDHPFAKIIAELEQLNCAHLQIRFFDSFDNDEIISILEKFNYSGIRSIELILPFDEKSQHEKRIQLYKQFTRLSRIILYSSPEEEIFSEEQIVIEKVTRHIVDHKDCGIINSENFILNNSSFMEARKFNSCLNKKISIDAKGEIKNCPSLMESYGNIQAVKLTEAINKSGFKKYWNIKKDEIAVCKDCEFRYICTDCRAYLQDPDDIYSKPLKCGYNPYTGNWEEWSTNPLKQMVAAQRDFNNAETENNFK